ncbi:head-tail adaptor protein [Diaphorobacter sp. HDW4B]|uniref:phage head completion protein n=1 Tax=Diaphorobacter sp. HDW4B TaxID=2714925 RepID=UPI00140769BD|nr:head-tail adaptor protein [Diaphorobacter sp. HDW4B]QIL71666.1 head-tail adaptor protein [Diaphorobacter sp. HDW4B]
MGYVVTRDPDYNTEIKTWGVLDTVWASVLDVLPSRSETVQNAVEIVERPSKVRMRYRTDITPDMRLVIVGADGAPDRECEIVAGPAEIGRREGVELLVKSFRSSG